MTTARNVSLLEMLSYTTVFALVIAVWSMNEPPALIAIPAIFAPGALVAGPIGLLLGGRRAFLPVAFLGTALWAIAIIIPALGAVR